MDWDLTCGAAERTYRQQADSLSVISQGKSISTFHRLHTTADANTLDVVSDNYTNAVITFHSCWND
jgi:hypothetical protein